VHVVDAERDRLAGGVPSGVQRAAVYRAVVLDQCALRDGERAGAAAVVMQQRVLTEIPADEPDLAGLVAAQPPTVPFGQVEMN